VNANAPRVQLFQNTVEAAGGFVKVTLVGGARIDDTEGWSNRDGVGAIVTAHIGERVTAFEQGAGEGFASQNSATIVIGLGEAAKIDQLIIRWPSGREQVVSDIAGSAEIVVSERQE
jgi:hypothetical protein